MGFITHNGIKFNTANKGDGEIYQRLENVETKLDKFERNEKKTDTRDERAENDFHILKLKDQREELLVKLRNN